MNLLSLSASVLRGADCFPGQRKLITKTLRVMKLMTIFLLAAVIHVSAKVTAQTVTYSANIVPLGTVFSEIEKQTGFVFFFLDEDVKNSKPVTVKLESVDLKVALHTILENQPLGFELQGNTILISKKIIADAIPRVILDAPPVTGIVRGPDGQTLAGVNIIVKGTKRGTTTKADGTFSINAKKGEVLVISSVGYLPEQLTISSPLGIEVLLKLSTSKLDEVQVMAYGTTSRRTSTGTIGTIKSSDIQKQPVNDPLLALQGRVAGVIVTPTSGNFGAKVNVQIRGQNSLNFRSNPLFIIDDVPVDNESFKLDNTILPGGNLSPFSYLNPNDIESINVLKDADATAIYGSRGSNGVILITTKKGRAGRTSINLNVQSGFSEVAKKLKLLNTQQYLEMRKEAYSNDGLDYTTGAITKTNSDLRLYDQNRYTDWQETMIGGNAKYQDYQANVSGGSNIVQYVVGGNYHRETTVYPGDNSNQKGNIHFSLNGNSSDNRFKVGFTGNYLVDNMNTGPADYTQNIFFAPNAPGLLNPDGTINWAINPETGESTWFYKGNPYANNLQRSESKVYSLFSNLNISYDIIKNLQAKIVTGYNRLTGSNTYFTPATSWEPLYRSDPNIVPFLRNASFSNSITENISVEPQVVYALIKTRHNLNALFGGSFQSNLTQTDYLSLYGFSNDALLMNRSAGVSISDKRNTTLQYKYSAVFSRLTYKFDEKYIVNFNIRRDGSSRFGPGYRFGNFGSAAAAWIFSSENLFQKKLPALSFGKLKFSYGTTGNDGIQDYKYFETYSITNSTVLYQNDAGYTSNGAVNTDYHWETVRKMELGLELGFFKDRVLFQANYFRNISNSQLIYYPIPVLAGYGDVYVNLPAKLQNNGLELQLTTVNMKSKNFSWLTDINFTRNRNKLLEYTDIDKSSYYLSQIGEPFYGYRDLYRFGGVDATTGQYQFYNSDGTVTSSPGNATPPYYGRDARVITFPKFYGGVSNSLIYKGVTFDVFFQFVKQNGINPIYNGPSFGFGYTRTNQMIEVLSRWQKADDQTSIMKFTTGFPSSPVSESSIAYTDASFVRLKNFSIGYNLPGKWIQKYGLQKCKFYFQGQNTYTFTEYAGLDPETQSLTTLPPLRVWTVGLQIGL